MIWARRFREGEVVGRVPAGALRRGDTCGGDLTPEELLADMEELAIVSEAAAILAVKATDLRDTWIDSHRFTVLRREATLLDLIDEPSQALSDSQSGDGNDVSTAALENKVVLVLPRGFGGSSIAVNGATHHLVLDLSAQGDDDGRVCVNLMAVRSLAASTMEVKHTERRGALPESRECFTDAIQRQVQFAAEGINHNHGAAEVILHDVLLFGRSDRAIGESHLLGIVLLVHGGHRFFG